MKFNLLHASALALLCGLSCNAAALDNAPSGVTVTTLLKTTTSWDGKAITYPSGQAEITGMLIELAPGKEIGWHEHPVPSFGMLQEGILEVTLQNGQIKRLQAGDTLAEVIDTPHKSRNVGDQPVKLLVFYAGAAGKPLTVKHPEIMQ